MGRNSGKNLRTRAIRRFVYKQANLGVRRSFGCRVYARTDLDEGRIMFARIALTPDEYWRLAWLLSLAGIYFTGHFMLELPNEKKDEQDEL